MIDNAPSHFDPAIETHQSEVNADNQDEENSDEEIEFAPGKTFNNNIGVEFVLFKHIDQISKFNNRR